MRESEIMSESDQPLAGDEQLAFEVMGSRLFPEASTPARIGRFSVLRVIGRGGMGVVYAAHDEALDRKVAVKLLRTDIGESNARTRLLREAQGLARLSHPNVVQVHEVGEDRGGVFVAMEFIAGVTLREWLEADAERSWRERLETLVQAGRGLEAAHRAGLVHRDFKPDNVMVGLDGRVRVLDFGLVRGLGASFDDELGVTNDDDGGHARAIEGGSDTPVQAEPGATPNPRALLGRSLTARGTIMGTPAYMAPEQHRGEPCDALADQFAFCVAAFEALFGHRPFSGRTRSALAKAVAEGARSPIPGDSRVPRRVSDAILRGLSVERERRWADLGVLLDELDRARVARWRRAAGWIAGGLIGAALATGGALALGVADEPERCAIDASLLAGVWDDDRRASVRGAFLATQLSFADETFSVLAEALDDWSGGWLDARRAACEATHVEGTQSEASLDARTACLDHRRRQLDALLTELAGADARIVGHTAELIERLPDLGACRNPETAGERFSIAAEREPALREAELELARADSLLRTRQSTRARVLFDELRARAETLDHLPHTLAVRMLEGDLMIAGYRYDEAADTLLAVAREATGAQLDELTASARVSLARALVGEWSRPQREEALLAEARAALERLERPEDPRGLELVEAEARLRGQAGEHQRMLELFDEALAGTRELDHSARVRRIVGRASALRGLGEYDRADAAYRVALAEASARFGADSPTAADVELSLAALALDRGRNDEASASLDRAQAAFTASFGPDSPRVAHVNFARAKLALNSGRFDEVVALIGLVLPVFVGEFGEGHELVGQARNAEGVARYYLGDFRGSIDSYARALAVQATLLGAEHPEIAALHSNIGESWVALGEHARALESFGQAIAGLASEPDHPVLMLTYKGRGQSLLALGDGARALEELEHALAIAEATGAPEIVMAEIHFALAQALAASEREPARARTLATRARQTFTKLELDEQAEEVARWLER